MRDKLQPVEDAVTKGADYIAQFSIPMTRLESKPTPGKYRVLVFTGDECSKPVDAFIPE